MKSFEDWVLVSPAIPLNQKPMLPEGLWEDAKGHIMAECRCCECWYDTYMTAEEAIQVGWSQDMSYCGRSERCCP